MRLDKIAKQAALFFVFEATQNAARALVALWHSRQERKRKREERNDDKRTRKALQKLDKRLQAHAAAISLILQRQAAADEAEGAATGCSCAAPCEDTPDE